jgi:hypothetical protein
VAQSSVQNADEIHASHALLPQSRTDRCRFAGRSVLICPRSAISLSRSSGAPARGDSRLAASPGEFCSHANASEGVGCACSLQRPCTKHHCIYEITVEDEIDDWFRNPSDMFPNFEAMRSLWIRDAYAFFGGRPGFAVANVRVRDDRMWGADFSLGLWAYPGKGRNEGEGYVVLASTLSSSRLSDRNNLQLNAVRRGFRTESVLNCLGCEFVEAFLTPQTNARDIERFNDFDFSCITAIRACKDPVDIAPDAWNQSLKDKQDQVVPEQEACELPPTILAREANDVVLAKVLSLITDPTPGAGPPDQWAKVKILKPLKNGRIFPIGRDFEFVAGSMPCDQKISTRRLSLSLEASTFFYIEARISTASLLTRSWTRAIFLPTLPRMLYGFNRESRSIRQTVKRTIFGMSRTRKSDPRFSPKKGCKS